MVKRKPVNPGAKRASSGLPYPVTPVSPAEPTRDSQLRPFGAEGFQNSSAGLPFNVSTPDMANSTSAWANDYGFRNDTSSRLSPVLRVGEGKQSTNKDHEGNMLPSTLRAGPMDDTPRSSLESQKSLRHAVDSEQGQGPNPSSLGQIVQDHHSDNPFLRTRHNNGSPSQENSAADGRSTDVWAENMAGMSIRAPKTQHSNPILDVGASDLPGGLSERSPFAEPWVGSKSSPAQDLLATNMVSQHTSVEQVYRDMAGNPYLADGPDGYHANVPNFNNQAPDSENCGLPDTEVSSAQQLGGIAASTSRDPRDIATRLPNVPPAIEARGIESRRRGPEEDPDAPPPQPPRPKILNDSAQPDSFVPLQTNRDSGEPQLSEAEKQQNRTKKQRSETYQIRLVNWYDASCSTNPRRSPIMVQNANGPCPLLALVNALVLSTPASVDTALVETLQIREQVSLGLLLDAVIDELMSGRRGDAAQELPDVSDLYTFLVTLHTGMNVNPCFVPSEAGAPNLMDAPASELPIRLQQSRKAGEFEDTREMRLYSTFAIPLIHGWLPPRNHAAFSALQRSAKTYEDAQNLMFMEEVLEDKLQQQGLNPQEQLLLEDVASIKYFLSSSATQLTGYGLDTIMDALPTGSISILFRNDHFSTLYKNPQSGQLFTLVTDMGYAGHDEVVWESLVDISGEACELFAGDFRSVGHNTGKQLSPSNGVAMSDDSGWTTVGRNSNNRSRPPLGSGEPQRQNLGDTFDSVPPLSSLSLGEVNETPKSPNTEQEDHDLALALQLQEEEEDRERRETAARRHEDELSQAYLEQQGPSARRGPVRASEVRPVVPPRGRKPPTTGEDAPPPTYEQAAKVPAYHPPDDDPLALPGNNNSARPQGTRQRQSSAYSQNTAVYSGSPSTHNANFAGSPMRGNPRRRSSARGGMAGGYEGAPGPSQRRTGYQGQGVVAEEEDKKDCIVM